MVFGSSHGASQGPVVPPPVLPPRSVSDDSEPAEEDGGSNLENEARHDFIGEAILFAMLVITAAVPLVSAAYAVTELCRAFGQL